MEAKMLYRNKLRWIRKYVEGRNVLDLGCVCHELDVQDPPWLHGYLCEHAESVLGVDLLPEAIAQLQQRGYNVQCANVEQMDLGEKFDVVVAGDIIEHLSNLGGFLDRVKAHLRPGGVLLVATPNPLTLVRFLRLLTSGRVRANKQHTCWFTAKVLDQLGSRSGFEVIDESYADDTRYYYRLWPRLRGHGGAGRRAWRRVRTSFKHLLWLPWILLSSVLCLVRPRMAETLCMALRIPAEDEAASSDQ